MREDFESTKLLYCKRNKKHQNKKGKEYPASPLDLQALLSLLIPGQ
jgi:hypothetical protein